MVGHRLPGFAVGSGVVSAAEQFDLLAESIGRLDGGSMLRLLRETAHLDRMAKGVGGLDGTGAPAAFGVPFPAGTDKNGRVKGASFFLNSNTFQYVSLGTISGYENGAWLIRATGTQQTQTQNQPPQAVAQVSTPQAKVGESISFNASNSTDSDGQIVAYLWTFGDGQTSTQPVTTHAYAAAGTYTISLVGAFLASFGFFAAMAESCRAS